MCCIQIFMYLCKSIGFCALLGRIRTNHTPRLVSHVAYENGEHKAANKNMVLILPGM